MPLTPHVLCSHCEAVFPSTAAMDEVVTCPVCHHVGAPAGVMRSSDFPDVESFRRSMQATLEQKPSEEG